MKKVTTWQEADTWLIENGHCVQTNKHPETKAVIGKTVTLNIGGMSYRSRFFKWTFERDYIAAVQALMATPLDFLDFLNRLGYIIAERRSDRKLIQSVTTGHVLAKTFLESLKD